MSCDELDGVIAFDNVLDRLIDAERRAHSASFEASALRSDMANTENELSRVRKERNDLKVAADRDRPRLFALWEAADELLRGQTKTTEAGDKLRKALSASSDACDQIPF